LKCKYFISGYDSAKLQYCKVSSLIQKWRSLIYSDQKEKTEHIMKKIRIV